MRVPLLLALVLVAACSPKVQPPDPESLKPTWLKTTPYQDGYYTGIGHSVKTGNNNYIQSAKKSALDDLVQEIRVNISSTSILSQLETNQKLSEQYQQTIQTTAADEIEEFELVDAWEDNANYWVYYRLSIARYRQIKEEQRRTATTLAVDFFLKARAAQKAGENMMAVTYYFQSLRSVEKYLGEAITVNVENKDMLLVNEAYTSIQGILDKIALKTDPSHIALNRRISQDSPTSTAFVTYKEKNKPVANVPLHASFEKGSGDVFPTYKSDDAGKAKILMNKIGSRELEQTVAVKVDINSLAGSGLSPLYSLLISTFNVPTAQIALQVHRPLVFITSTEKSFGFDKTNAQITNKLKNLLANNGFEFTDEKNRAELWFDVKADSEKGSITGSIYVTYLTGVIRVATMKDGKEIYATTLDRVKGYGLDYDKSSVDAYNKAMETLEKERMTEMLETVLQ
ncbi:LPP20 family lipoprotein [Chryseolinea sp. T2]|uniref:LPP20 family lipoprotein n=1 Tax=Chryseolinea sp. T2 TaxID=3129255 RepID=UPI0030783E47